MATVLKGYFDSMREKTRFDVYVDDGAPSGGTIDQINVISASIKHEAAKKEIDAYLIPSKLKVSFLAATPAQKAVFDDISDSAETRFKIRVERAGSLYFVGFVLLDLLTVDDTAGAYKVTIEATDGIGRLKSIDYDGGGVFYDDYVTLFDHLQTILSAIPLTDYYSAGSEYLRTNCNLWPDGLTPDGTTDQMKLIRCSYRAFRVVDSKGAVKFSSYYDVLQEICKALGVRFFYSAGRYVMADISDYARTVGSVRFLRYDITGAALAPEILGGGGGTQWDDWTTTSGDLSDYLAQTKDVATRAGGKLTRLPALQAVAWTYRHYSKQNALSGIIEWSNNDTSNISIQNFRTAAGLRLRISASAEIQVTPPNSDPFPGAPVYAVFGMKLFVTDDNDNATSVVRTENLATVPVSYSDPEWLGGEVGRYYGFTVRAEAPQLGNPIFTLNTTTPVVPESGVLSMRFYLKGIYLGSDLYAGATAQWRVWNPYMETAIDGAAQGQFNFSNFKAENTAFPNNSVTIERKALLGDGPNANTFGRLEYFDGTEWMNTNNWRKYAGGAYLDASGKLHGAIRARDILALQERPRQKIQGTQILRNYAFENIYLRASKRYLPYKAKYNLVDDIVTGEWLEIAYQPATLVFPDENPSDTDGDTGAGGIEPDTSGPSTTGTEIDPDDVPPGLLVPGLNTVNNGLDGELPEGDTTSTLPVVVSSDDVPYFTNDLLVITSPVAGDTQLVTVAYDSALGVPADDQVNPPPGAVPFYGPSGVVWLVPDGNNVAIDDVTPGATFPVSSFVQFDAAYIVRLRALLRKTHIDGFVFGFDENIVTGFAQWYWRASLRIGWQIRKVHFAFAQDMGGSAKLNLKYYDGGGYRYTVATFDGGGLGGVVDCAAVALDGYYRLQVETITGTAPKGLTLNIEIIKIYDDA